MNIYIFFYVIKLNFKECHTDCLIYFLPVIIIATCLSFCSLKLLTKYISEMNINLSIYQCTSIILKITFDYNIVA